MVTREEIFQRVRDIIVDRLNVKKDKVTIDSTFLDDLGADSLELTELVLAVEEEFSLKIPDEQIEQLTSVARVVAFVESCLSASAG